jgi:hypothetical protein
MTSCWCFLTRYLVRTMEGVNRSRLAVEMSCGRWAYPAPRFSRKMRHEVRLQPARPCSTVPAVSWNSVICESRSTVTPFFLQRVIYIRWDELAKKSSLFEDSNGDVKVTTAAIESSRSSRGVFLRRNCTEIMKLFFSCGSTVLEGPWPPHM